MNVGQAIARLQAVYRPRRRCGAHGRALPAPGFVLSKTRIAVAGAGLHRPRARRGARGEPDVRAVRHRRPVARRAAQAAERRRAAVPIARGAARRSDRPDGVVLATPNQLHVPQALQCIDAGLPILLEKPIAPTRRRGRAAGRGGRRSAGAGPHRPSPRAQPDHGEGERGDRLRRARPAGRGHGQRRVLQARPLLRRRAVAPRARRRPDPAQHDPRGPQPAHAVRRDRRGAGVRIERDARLPGRGHGGDQPALRQRCARHLPALRHRRLARAAGSRPRRRTRPTPATTTRTATSSRAPTAAWRCRPCGSRPTPRPRTGRGGSRSRPASRR